MAAIRDIAATSQLLPMVARVIAHASRRLFAEEWRLAVSTAPRWRRVRTAGASWMTSPASYPFVFSLAARTSSLLPALWLARLVVELAWAAPVLGVVTWLLALLKQLQQLVLGPHRRGHL